jgi:hypothetical protein
MGMYDAVKISVISSQVCQVKCWDNDMTTYTVGDTVPDVGGFRSYSVALQEYVSESGLPHKFVNVARNRITGISRFPRSDATFDKWGNPLSAGRVNPTEAARAYPFYLHGGGE